MARNRRSRSDIGINLFSFLNIMTATIGVQTLLIVIFSLQIKPGVQSIRLRPPAVKDVDGKQITFFAMVRVRTY